MTNIESVSSVAADFVMRETSQKWPKIVILCISN